MGSKRVSGKTHTKEQLDKWANQHNPNNKMFCVSPNIPSEFQKADSRKTHQQIHNSRRRHGAQLWPEWAPDYPEYDD